MVNSPVNQSWSFRVVQVVKSLQDPLEVGNNLPGIDDNVRERGTERKCAASPWSQSWKYEIQIQNKNYFIET